MKNIFIIILVFLSLFCNSSIFADDNPNENSQNASDYDTLSLKKEMNLENNESFRKFITVINKEEFKTGNVICYTFKKNESRNVDLLIQYLFKDRNVLKLYPKDNKIALLVNQIFDIALFEKKAIELNCNILPITKDFFTN